MSNELDPRKRARTSRVGLVGATMVATALTAGVAASIPLTVAAQSEASPAPEASVTPDGGANGVDGWQRPGRLGGFGDRGFGGRNGDRGFGGRFGGGFRDEVAGFLGERLGRSAITVDANDGTSLTVSTANGWTRTIDTTNVVLTRDGETIAIGDIAVGDNVAIHESANSDGSYTVTEIAVVLPRIVGTVAEVGTDSFTVTKLDGTTQTVYVSDATIYVIPGATETGLAAITAGSRVMAQGTLRDDGSLDATDVWSAMRGLRNGVDWPTAPQTPTDPAASPAADGEDG